MLIIDVTKGMQTQTAECLVIGEITCGKMIVVLNKIDLIPEAKRQTSIDKVTIKQLPSFDKILIIDELDDEKNPTNTEEHSFQRQPSDCCFSHFH